MTEVIKCIKWTSGPYEGLFGLKVENCPEIGEYSLFHLDGGGNRNPEKWTGDFEEIPNDKVNWHFYRHKDRPIICQRIIIDIYLSDLIDSPEQEEQVREANSRLSSKIKNPSEKEIQPRLKTCP